MADASGFPNDELLALAEHFENIGRAWNPETMTGRALREECFGRAQVCRTAITKYQEQQEQVAVLQRASSPPF